MDKQEDSPPWLVGKAASHGSRATLAWSSGLSLLLHGLLLLLLLYLFPFREGGSPPPVTIPIELVERQAPPPPVPEPEPLADARAQTSSIVRPVTKPTLPAAVPAKREVDPTGEEEEMAAFRSALGQGLCPRFVDPQDLKLVERCSRHAAGSALGPLNTDALKVAQHLAEDQEKLALSRGWVGPPPLTPEQQVIEAESTLEAPGADLFGPWPWEKK